MDTQDSKASNVSGNEGTQNNSSSQTQVKSEKKEKVRKTNEENLDINSSEKKKEKLTIESTQTLNIANQGIEAKNVVSKNTSIRNEVEKSEVGKIEGSKLEAGEKQRVDKTNTTTVEVKDKSESIESKVDSNSSNSFSLKDIPTRSLSKAGISVHELIKEGHAEKILQGESTKVNNLVLNTGKKKVSYNGTLKLERDKEGNTTLKIVPEKPGFFERVLIALGLKKTLPESSREEIILKSESAEKKIGQRMDAVLAWKLHNWLENKVKIDQLKKQGQNSTEKDINEKKYVKESLNTKSLNVDSSKLSQTQKMMEPVIKSGAAIPNDTLTQKFKEDSKAEVKQVASQKKGVDKNEPDPKSLSVNGKPGTSKNEDIKTESSIISSTNKDSKEEKNSEQQENNVKNGKLDENAQISKQTIKDQGKKRNPILSIDYLNHRSILGNFMENFAKNFALIKKDKKEKTSKSSKKENKEGKVKSEKVREKTLIGADFKKPSKESLANLKYDPSRKSTDQLLKHTQQNKEGQHTGQALNSGKGFEKDEKVKNGTSQVSTSQVSTIHVNSIKPDINELKQNASSQVILTPSLDEKKPSVKLEGGNVRMKDADLKSAASDKLDTDYVKSYQLRSFQLTTSKPILEKSLLSELNQKESNSNSILKPQSTAKVDSLERNSDSKVNLKDSNTLTYTGKDGKTVTFPGSLDLQEKPDGKIVLKITLDQNAILHQMRSPKDISQLRVERSMDTEKPVIERNVASIRNVKSSPDLLTPKTDNSIEEIAAEKQPIIVKSDEMFTEQKQKLTQKIWERKVTITDLAKKGSETVKVTEKEKVKIPDTIHGAKLSDLQKERLAKGETIRVEGLKAKGTVFSADVTIDRKKNTLTFSKPISNTQKVSVKENEVKNNVSTNQRVTPVIKTQTTSKEQKKGRKI
ncbi:DUF4099 domain-containing protein [Cytophagaceae bacterium DM2B3-1]|uniref:DUF4099 domain-containing protein n=1 Tax=Xanthocytophaga flava TaxID=3048013 RepID=A0ABT7CV29_9BACT|nr:DUF4099 domain-containing protein [Xanthocytophaga flavus]MDJ1497588.1 DUF4099 domain-containing protein [Xanthocytophaga flavus]